MGKYMIVLSLHGLVWAGAVVLAFWAAGAAGAATVEGARYDTATPYTPYRNYKYIPLHSSKVDNSVPSEAPSEEPYTQPRMPASELILTALRTALDVVRNINKNRARTHITSATSARNSTALQLRRTKPSNGTDEGRGFEDYYDEHPEHHHIEETTTAKPVKQGRYTDPWAGYYDWIINEGSFKFWSVFQLFTAALLLYACFSAIYYAKFNPIIPDYSLEYDDYFLERTVGRKARSLDASELPSGLSWINPTMFQFILDAISKHYEEE